MEIRKQLWLKTSSRSCKITKPMKLVEILEEKTREKTENSGKNAESDFEGKILKS